jgi:hypothetical protein
MRISRPQFCTPKVPFVGEAKQRMVADLIEITVKGWTLLVSVGGISGGIDIDDEPPFVSAPKQGVGGSTDHIFQGFQPLTSCEDVVFKATQCGLAGSAFMLFSQS